MRILMAACVPGRREGGVAGVMQNLARELERLGHTVDFAFREDLMGDAPPGRFDVLAFAAQLARKVLREKKVYTVVNIHAPYGCAYGFLRSVLRLKHLPPYIMTMHGLEERRVHAMRREHRKGHAWHFGFKNRLWHRVYEQPLYRFCIRTADRSVILNREAWSFVQLKYDLDADRVWYVPNGVEERFLVPRDYPGRVAPRLLFVGTWLDQRGITYLSDALDVLTSKLPEVTLTIAGCSADERLVKETFPARLHSRLEVIPFVESARMPPLYAAHDIFVFPSLMEGMPLALLEAMATGMPVVTTETCGMPDVITDDTNGILVPVADAVALGGAIERVTQSVELRRRLGQAAQETMRHYTWDKIACRIEKIFLLAAQKDYPSARPAASA
jgi:glycosyltransferase involved in cell wall biosynthesis